MACEVRKFKVRKDFLGCQAETAERLGCEEPIDGRPWKVYG